MKVKEHPDKTYHTVYDNVEFQDGATLALEALCDKFDINRVVEWLANVAFDKADHLQSNWQDTNASEAYCKLAKHLNNAPKV